MPTLLIAKQLFKTRRFAKFAILAFVAFGVMGLTFAASTSELLFNSEEAKPEPSDTSRVKPVNKPPSQAVPRVKTGYVRRAGLQPRLREALAVMGNRLEDGGKERLVLDGTLRAAGQGQPLRVRVIRELGDKLHFEETGYGRRHSLTFDGQRTRKVGNGSGVPDESLLETLLNDSADHFFAGQFQGLATRVLGFRFRLDDGTEDKYAGPFYDLYRVEDQVRVSGEVHQRVKLYYLNSDTQLLERVHYKIERDGVPVDIEVVLADWHRVRGEMVPRQITRVEAGVTVLTLRFESISLAPRAEDGLFPRADEQ